MPAAPKKKKAGKKDSKKSAEKKGLKGLQTISALLKSLRLQYEVKCNDEQSFVLPAVKNSIKEYEEKCEFLVKVRLPSSFLLLLRFICQSFNYITSRIMLRCSILHVHHIASGIRLGVIIRDLL
jgi:hypothetical protein